MLRKHMNPKSGKMEWALMSVSKPGKVLEWYGSKKPSSTRVAKSEKRIQWFKNKKK